MIWPYVLGGGFFLAILGFLVVVFRNGEVDTPNPEQPPTYTHDDPVGNAVQDHEGDIIDLGRWQVGDPSSAPPRAEPGKKA